MFEDEFKRKEIMARQTIETRRDEYATYCSTHLKEIIEERNIAEEVIDGNEIESESGCFAFKRGNYSLVKFNEVTFGTGDTENNELVEVADVCFYYSQFSTCCFSNVKFSNCIFVGCSFFECYTMGLGVFFENCNFHRNIPGKKSVDDMPSRFEGCELIINLLKCDVTKNLFINTNFFFSRFEDTDLHDAIFADSGFDTMVISDCDLRNAQIIHTKFIEFSVEDSNKKTRVNRNTFLGEINFDKKQERGIRFAVETYITFNELYEKDKVSGLSGEYFYLFKKTELLTLTGTSKIISWLSYLLCGYGERPSFCLIASFLLVFICGTLYMFCGVEVNNVVMIFRPTWANPFPPLANLIQWYHFSLVTFSTVGYGNVVPVGGSMIVSAVEMVLAVVMVGIWVSTLVRKMSR
jgi:uncharacterized protein YjbI with pentapeptide repeats